MAQKIYERPVRVTKDIYPVIARKYKSTPSNVEHNIRTLVNLCWMNHKDTLEEMAGCTMADKPTNSEFIDILVYYLRYSDKEDVYKRQIFLSSFLFISQIEIIKVIFKIKILFTGSF